MRPVPPNVRILAGIPVLWLAGFLVQVLVGAAPARGWRVNRALDAEAEGRAAEAAVVLGNLADEHPDSAALWIRAGHAAVAAGRPLEGAERLQHAAKLDPDSIKARYEWIKALMACGLDDEAEPVLQELLELKADHGDGLFLGAALAAGRGDAGLATTRLAAALEARCSSPERWRVETRFDRARADAAFQRVARDMRYAAELRAVRP